MLAGGAQVSSLYIQPHLGGDAALMAAMAKGLIEQNATDQAFINNYTEGFDEFKASIEALNWQELISQSGVTKSDIDTLVTLLRTSKTVFLPGVWALPTTPKAWPILKALPRLPCCEGT